MYNSDKKHMNMLASIVAKNNAGELEAIEGYAQLLATPGFPQELYDDIREIISDEMHHNLRLNYWFTQLTEIHAAET